MKRWFGLPRWLVLGAALGVVVCLITFTHPVKQHVVSPRVRGIVDGLRDTSVYVAPGAPGKVDPERARRAVGDRPIVVVILDATPLPKGSSGSARQQLCGDIADAVSTNIVLLFAADDKGKYESAICTGPDFSNPRNPVDADHFDLPLIVAAETAWTYRVSDQDLTPQVEEYVLAFDAQAAKDYPQGVPRRAIIQPPPPTPDPVQTWQIILSLGGIVAGCIALFLLLRLLGLAIRRRGTTAAESDRRRTELSARLNKLADTVLNPGSARDAAEASAQAETAKRYVLVLHRFDKAGTDADLAEVDRELSTLERS